MTRGDAPTHLPLRIEPIREDDLPAVARIDSTSFKRVSTNAVADSLAQLREEMARPWSHLWVARNEIGHVVGFASVWLVVDELHLLNIATDAGERKRGVGSALMHHVFDFAKSSQARHILLEVRRGNDAAIRLYRRAGFYVSGVRKDYYPDREDAVEMVLVLDSATGQAVRKPDEVELRDAK